jgi:CMP-N-acetylneuraminic acid synthetase
MWWNEVRILGIIPARKGSKRLPGKNTKKIGDKTLIDIAIQEALLSNITDVLVTTNDKKVKKIASKYDVIIHDRDESLCADDSPSEDAIADVVKKYKYNLYVLLQPTSPLRTYNHINDALSKYRGVTIISTHRGRKNGAIYIFKKNITKTYFPYEMDGICSVDIDTKEDLSYARKAYRRRNDI